MVAYESAPVVDLRVLWKDAHFIKGSSNGQHTLGGEGFSGTGMSERQIDTEFFVSRCVTNLESCLPGDAFVALDLPERDSHQDALVAVAAGAAIVITERYLPVAVPQCIVDDSRQAWGELCHALEGNPTDELIMIGIAGTHGKTTLNLLTSSLMKSIGKKVAYRNSIATSDGETMVPAIDAEVNCPRTISKWLAGACAQKSPSAVLEIDHEMLYRGSTAGIRYDLLILTSLRCDKKGKESNVKQLQQAILKQIAQLKEHGLVLYNADDAPLARWLQSLALPAMSYGVDADADVQAKVIEREIFEQTLMITAGRTVMPLRSPLVGRHNARHLLGAVAAGYVCGLELSEVVGGVERLQRVPGRLQRVDAGQGFGLFVDQADSADRLAASLHAMRQHSTGRVLCVMDVSWRLKASELAAMGKVLEKGASEICLTHASGGTFKSAQKNAFALLDGFENPALPHVLPDRDKAIEWIIQRAKPGDVILLAGCGDRNWTSKSRREATSDLHSANYWLRQPREESSQTLLKAFGEVTYTSDITSSAADVVRDDKPKLKLFRPE